MIDILRRETLPDLPQGVRPLFLSLTTLAISISAWTFGVTGAAAAFPLIWWQAKNRAEAMSVATLYYLAGSWVIPGAADAFFAESNSWFLGMCLWATSSLLLALPWGMLRPFGMKGFVAALLLVSVPPLGIIGWLNPLLAAADLFPGSGFFGLAAVLVLFVLWPLRSRLWMLAGLSMFSLAANLAYQPPTIPSSWKAVDTALGKYPADVVSQAYWHTTLTRLVKAEAASNVELLVLPEQIGGWFTPQMESIWQRELKYSGVRPTQMILLGGERPLSDRLYANSLFVWLGDELLGTIGARQTVPVSMWRPYASTGTHAPIDWFKPNLYRVPLQGKPVPAAFFFCYEEFLMFPQLMTLASGRPYAMISVVNGWWSSPAEQTLQRQHIQAWSKLFRLPLLRAVNSRAP
ncbi:hypothetical protein [Gulbenkiania mobilis]|uniref:hypothetical protein n=1 Tax=Gulbenkiania mobilis TaxID=397457 RepID=UPI0006BBE7BA|nr:hypothetical protein [Gulbenkiania mobilis]